MFYKKLRYSKMWHSYNMKGKHPNSIHHTSLHSAESLHELYHNLDCKYIGTSLINTIIIPPSFSISGNKIQFMMSKCNQYLKSHSTTMISHAIYCVIWDNDINTTISLDTPVCNSSWSNYVSLSIYSLSQLFHFQRWSSELITSFTEQ